MNNNTRNKLKEDIITILQNHTYDVDDSLEGLLHVIDDDSFEEVAEDITKVIEASYKTDVEPARLHQTAYKRVTYDMRLERTDQDE